MPDINRQLYSTACFFECTQGGGKLVGSFAEALTAAKSYRGKLLGLMAIHLVLLGVENLSPELNGLVTIYSNCVGALSKVKHLPPLGIPAQC
jgi:hypothetical protein